MKLLFTHAQILQTGEGSATVAANDFLGVQDEKILFVGAPPADFVPDRTIDCHGGLLIPGFVNAHTHSPLCLLRGRGEDRCLQDWLSNIVWPFEAKHTYESCYWGTLLNAAESIRCGTTCLNDMYIHSDAVAAALDDCGLRALVTATVTDELLSQEPDRLQGIAALERRYRGHPRLRIGVAPHAVYTCSDETLHRVAQLCGSTGMPVHIHVSETCREVETCAAHTGGKTPLQYLDSFGLVQSQSLLAHCTHLTKEEIRLLADRGACAVHCPRSNLKLGSGIADVRRFLEAEARVALGTDSSASNNNQDVWEELRFAALLQKGVHGDPTLLPIRECLSMAFHAPLASMGFPEGGVLAPGAPADLVLLDTQNAAWLPNADPLADLLYAAPTGSIVLTMVAGRVLYENGTYLSIDMDRLRFAIDRTLRQFGL